MKRRIMCLLLTLCMAATLMVFPAFADNALTITGTDRVCFAQDYEFSFVLPDGYTDPNSGYEATTVGSEIDLTVRDGVCYGVVKAEWFGEGSESMEIIVHATDPNGNDVSARKTVIISKEHTGEAAWSITPNRHEQVWSCCGTVIVPSESHSFKNGVCSVCGAYDINEQSKFSDVKAGAYYYDSVKWAVENEVTKGMTKTEFQPDGTCTRAQVVTFLWRAAGKPTADVKVAFTDVKEDAYYYKAVQWAVANKITNGIDNTTFDPDGACTRAQVVTFLWRANGSKAVSGNAGFVDVPADAYYASAVQWAVENEITNGMGNKQFAPNGTCTRAQAVTFLFRTQDA